MIQRLITLNRVIYALLVLGIGTRLAQYGHNRSLWLDEVSLALNIKTRDFGGLLQPLDYNQSAPPLFLVIVKTLVTLFGSNEFVLRFVPLVATLVTLILLWRIMQRLDPISVPFALVLFIGSGGFIGYATEFKQYASDAAIALALLSLALVASEDYAPRRLLALTLTGIVAVWASHPSIFVLAGIGIVFFFEALWNKHKRLVAISAMELVWLGSFGAAYLLFYSASTANSDLTTYWSFAFLRSEASAILGSLLGLLVFLVGGLQIGWLVIVILGIGAGLWHLPRRISAILLAPILFTLIAALLHLYPFSHRLILFLIPGILVITAAGLGFLGQRLYAQHKIIALGMAIFLCGLFLVQPYIFEITEVREALTIVQQRAPHTPIYGDEYVRFVSLYYEATLIPVEELKTLTAPTWVIYDDIQAPTTETYMTAIGAQVDETIHVTGTTIRRYRP